MIKNWEFSGAWMLEPLELISPMSVLIRNARILTLAPSTGSGQANSTRPRRGKELADLGIIPAGEVLVADGKIAAVGAKVDAPADAEIIDALGRVLMPGFVDCHTHACWAGDRLDEWEMKLRGVPYLEILKKGGGIHSTVKAVREATQKQLAASLRDRLGAHAARRHDHGGGEERLRPQPRGRDEDVARHPPCRQPSGPALSWRPPCSAMPLRATSKNTPAWS
jgi:hypothetical protein